MLQLYPKDVKNAFFMQECDWEMAKKEHVELRQFCTALKKKPIRHVCFRDALRAQIQDALILRYEREEQKGQTMYMLDVNSCFPAMALQDMPTLDYKLHYLRKEDQHLVSFQGDQMLYNNVPVHAVALARVLPPRDLVLPYMGVSISSAGVSGNNLGEAVTHQ